MLLSPRSLLALSILTLLQTIPAVARNVCFFKSRAVSGCNNNQPYFCCSITEQGECCRSPAHDWCGCMEGNGLVHKTGVGHDAIMFYQTSDGKSLIDEHEYFTRRHNERITCDPFEKKLNECSIRVVKQYQERPPNRRPGISGGRNRRPSTRSPSELPSEQCRTADIVHYKLPNGLWESNKVPPNQFVEVMKLLNNGHTELIEELSVNEELRKQLGHPDAYSDNENGSSEDWPEVSDAGSSYGSEDVK